MTYNDACQKAMETDAELLKKVSSSWESTWEEIGPEYIKQQTKMFENIFKETNIEAIKKFNVQWEKFLNTSGDDSIMAYQEAIKKFNQAWQSGQM
jgi:ribonuclease HI